jgi:hypothetical protein
VIKQDYHDVPLLPLWTLANGDASFWLDAWVYTPSISKYKMYVLGL